MRFKGSEQVRASDVGRMVPTVPTWTSGCLSDRDVKGGGGPHLPRKVRRIEDGASLPTHLARRQCSSGVLLDPLDPPRPSPRPSNASQVFSKSIPSTSFSAPLGGASSLFAFQDLSALHHHPLRARVTVRDLSESPHAVTFGAAPPLHPADPHATQRFPYRSSSRDAARSETRDPLARSGGSGGSYVRSLDESHDTSFHRSPSSRRLRTRSLEVNAPQPPAESQHIPPHTPSVQTKPPPGALPEAMRHGELLFGSSGGSPAAPVDVDCSVARRESGGSGAQSSLTPRESPFERLVSSDVIDGVPSSSWVTGRAPLVPASAVWTGAERSSGTSCVGDAGAGGAMSSPETLSPALFAYRSTGSGASLSLRTSDPPLPHDRSPTALVASDVSRSVPTATPLASNVSRSVPTPSGSAFSSTSTASRSVFLTSANASAPSATGFLAAEITGRSPETQRQRQGGPFSLLVPPNSFANSSFPVSMSVPSNSHDSAGANTVLPVPVSLAELPFSS